MVTIFIWECFEHLVTRMRHVGETFVVALNQDCYEKRRSHLNRAIEYHNFLLRCANLMIESFKESIIIHIVQTGMLLGCIGYQLIQVGPI
ncbi:unnamed protein product [Phaedon cochleariae]|uniref:Odorant receptor n=1 Tax=Phaedon cochleariae TaxID=80249 RepID=A0A9P0GQ32_PHACE|nr:unnamed protein product [Phaedon cochleariae]